MGEAAALAGRCLLSMGVFALSAMSPFDPLAAYLGDQYERATPQQRAELTATLGLTQSWWTAWTTWVDAAAHGDLGQSRVFGQPVAQVIAERLPWTLLLSGAALTVATIGGVALGLAAGLRPASWLDRLCGGAAILLQSVPPYVLSLAAIAGLSLGVRWFPTGGATTPGRVVTPMSLAHHLVLPVLVLALSQLPWIALSLRAAVTSALASDAVRGAVARGLPWATVVRGHVLPVSLTPLVTLLGARLPELIVGAVLVEEVFAWPGLAAALVAAAQQLDFALLALLTVATTAVVLLGSLLADTAYLVLDPRVRVFAGDRAHA
ncbi:MAG: ABC transporter permease [Micrococcales bacterium]|nr:ABC transporter permease [Micrococcales bacterium]